MRTLWSLHSLVLIGVLGSFSFGIENPTAFAQSRLGRFGEQPSQTETKSPSVNATPGFLQLERVTLRDPYMRNMESHTVLVPKGWTAQGGGWWANPKFFRAMPTQNIVVASPDGFAVHFAPVLSYSDTRYRPHTGIPRPAEFTASNGQPVRYRPQNTGDWKRLREQELKATYPDATITVKDIVPLPAWKKELEKVVNLFAQGEIQVPGIQRSSNVEFYGIESKIVNNGKTFDDLNIFGVITYRIESDFATAEFWSVGPHLTFQAPQGQLEKNLPMLMTIANSMRETPNWLTMKLKHQAKMNKTDLDALRKRHRSWSQTFANIHKTNQEISDIYHNGYRNRESIRDNTQLKLVNGIREVQDFDFNGDQYQLPQQYDYAWGNGNGVIYMTEDPSFNPNEQSGNSQNWTRLRKIR